MKVTPSRRALQRSLPGPGSVARCPRVGGTTGGAGRGPRADAGAEPPELRAVGSEDVLRGARGVPLHCCLCDLLALKRCARGSPVLQPPAGRPPGLSQDALRTTALSARGSSPPWLEGLKPAVHVGRGARGGWPAGGGAPGASALPSLALGQRGSGVSGGRTWGRWTHVPRVPSSALRWVFSGQRAAPRPDVYTHSDSDASVGRGSPDPACRAREGPRPRDWPRGSHAVTLHAPDDFSSSVRTVTVQREGSQGFGVTHVTHFSSPSSHL